MALSAKHAMAFALLLLVFALLTAEPVEAEVSASLSNERTMVGEPVVLSIQVVGAGQSVELEAPEVDGAYLRSGGKQTKIHMLDTGSGYRQTEVHQFDIVVTPQRAGALEIPPFGVKVNGVLHETKPMRLHVSEVQTDEQFPFEVRFSKEQCFVGEPIELQAVFFCAEDAELHELNLPLLHDPRLSLAETLPRKNLRLIRLGDAVVRYLQERVERNGRSGTVAHFRKVVAPQEPGVIKAPGGRVRFSIEERHHRRPRSPFDGFFGERRAASRESYAPTVRLEVLPLPEKGRPASFNGLVGKYAVSAEASPRQVAVGDPITLTIRVEPPAMLPGIELPPLEALAPLEGAFTATGAAPPGVQDGSAVVFERMLRAVHEGVKEVPALSLPYFDPNAREYRMAKSASIPIRVEPARVLTPDDVEKQGAYRKTAEVVERHKGLAHNYEGLEALEVATASASHVLAQPLSLAALGAPPALFALAAAAGAVRRRKEGARGARRKALADLQNRLNEAEADPADGNVWEAIRSGLREFLLRRLDLPPGALTADSVAEELRERGITEDTVKRLQDLYARCEEHRYTGGARNNGDAEKCLEEARVLARRIDEEAQA
jgi:hypothetical protein